MPPDRSTFALGQRFDIRVEGAAAAQASLGAHSPAGFYLLVEGASIDKRAHDLDAERLIWEVIEFDQAVDVALQFARRTKTDADPDNDTLVVVTADHETGGVAIVGVGNSRYAPGTIGEAVRDYSAVYRFSPERVLELFPNYEIAPDGFPLHPDPTRKLLLGFAAGPDHFENWTSNRLALPAATTTEVVDVRGRRRVSVANTARDGGAPDSDNKTVEGRPLPGFFVTGTIENGAAGCRAADGCPGDSAADPHPSAGHTATDVPLSASGPGALQFTGTYENTDTFIKILRATTGAWRCGDTMLNSRGRPAEFPPDPGALSGRVAPRRPARAGRGRAARRSSEAISACRDKR